MAALESSLARVLQDFQEDRRKLTAVFAAERAEAQADICALRQLAKARGRALHKVRPPFPDFYGESSRIDWQGGRHCDPSCSSCSGCAKAHAATYGVTTILAGLTADTPWLKPYA